MSKIQDDPTASDEIPHMLVDEPKAVVTDDNGDDDGDVGGLAVPNKQDSEKLHLEMERSRLAELSATSSQEKPKELSEKEWRAIMKVDLKDKPKIQHPTLGEVVQVAPGVVARQVSAKEAYEKHLVTVADKKMPTDELERKRFSLLISARNNKDTDMIVALNNARTKEDMELAIGESIKKLRGIEHVANQKSVQQMFEHNEDEAKKVYEALKKDGRVLKLDPGMVSKEKTITPEAVAELRRRGVNVFIQRMPGSDPYMNKIRADAELATAFVEQRLGQFPDGIDANSTDEQRKELQLAAQASAAALSRLDAERDTITRSDGEELAVRINFEEFYTSMKAQRIETKDMRQFLHEHGHEIGMQMRHGEEKSSHTLVFLELLDCAVFVPRLCLAMAMDPMPRVVEFSRVYNVYRATSIVLRNLKLLKTRKQIEKLEDKKKAELKRKIRETSGDVVFPKNSDEEEPWMHKEIAVEDVSEEFGRMRVRARANLLDSVRAITEWFANESRHHSEQATASTTDAPTLPGPPTFSREEVTADPTVLVRYFYRNLWLFVQRFAGDVLRAYEFSILLQLHEYLPRSTATFWRSVARLPDNKQCPGVTKKLVKEENGHLTRWRTFSSELIDSLVAKKIKIDLSFPPAMANERVDPAIDWSPTFEQMEKYYRDMASLFVLSNKEVKRLVNEAAKKVNANKKKPDNAAVSPSGAKTSDLLNAVDEVVEREENET